MRLRWATGNVDPVSASIVLPPAANDGGMNGTVAAAIGIIVSSAGATNGWTNASGIITNWDGGANVTDALTDSADTVVHTIEAAIAASDIPDSPQVVTVTITPPTHATDALHLYGAYIRFTAVEAQLS
jgi:hypothetical protein